MLQRTDESLTNLVRRQQRFDWLQWLEPSDPSINYIAARKKRHARTGDWLFKSNEFQYWLFSKPSFLWINGIAGCGKTVLSSTVLSYLAGSEDGPGWDQILYYYFDFADQRKQSLEHAVRTFVHHLACRSEVNQQLLQAMWRSHGDGYQRPTLETLCALMNTMVQHYEEIWIMIDALDECTTLSESGGGGLLSWLETFVKSHPHVHMLVTSRPEPEIKASIQRWVPDYATISIESAVIAQDINSFVTAEVQHNFGLQRWRSLPHVQEEIEHSLSTRANGM